MTTYTSPGVRAQTPDPDSTWATTHIPLVSFLRYRGCGTFHFEPADGSTQLQAIVPRTERLEAALDEWEGGSADHFKAFASIHDDTFRRLKSALREREEVGR